MNADCTDQNQIADKLLPPDLFQSRFSQLAHSRGRAVPHDFFDLRMIDALPPSIAERDGSAVTGKHWFTAEMRKQKPANHGGLNENLFYL